AACPGSENERGLEPAYANLASFVGFLPPLLVAVQRAWQCRARQLRGGQPVPRRPGLASPRQGTARPHHQLGLSWRCRLSRRTSPIGRTARTPGRAETSLTGGADLNGAGDAASRHPTQRHAGGLDTLARVGRDGPRLAAFHALAARSR